MFVLYLIVTLIWLCLFFIYRKKMSKYASVMEGYPRKSTTKIPALPLLGVAHHFIGSNERRMKTLQLVGSEAVECGGAIADWLGHIPFLVIADAELGDTLLKTCLEKDDVAKLLRCVIGDGLVIAPSRMKTLQLIGREAVDCGGAITGWLGHIPFLVIADAELGDTLLKTCHDKNDITKLLRCVIGDGLVIAPMSVWRHRRKIILTTLTTKHLQKFHEVFNKQADVMVEQLKPKIGEEAFPVWEYLASNNLDALSETVYGIELHAQTDRNNPFSHSLREITAMVATRIAQPWLHSDFVFKLLPMYRSFKKHLHTLYTIVDAVIDRKRKEIEERPDKAEIQQKKITPFLELLLESSLLENGIAKGAYNDRELREETMTLTIAGTDTSAAGLAFAVLCLSRHQDVQDKVYKEVVEVFGNSNRPVELDDAKKLVYMDAVIKEAMRLFPPVPVFLRRVHEDITLPSGVLLPEGCTVMMNVWALHRNPKYWGNDAEEFKPERFLVPLQHQGQYMAFGYGPRNCPGYRYAMLSMKTVLTILLRRYRLLPNKEGDSPVRLSFEVFMKDADRYQIRLENRNAARSEG